MKTNLIVHFITAGLFATFASSSVQAGPGPANGGSVEPFRIYDIRSGNFIDNPSYQRPPVRKKVVQSDQNTVEPRRVYNAGSRQFEDNPDYVDTASVRQSSPNANRKSARTVPSKAGEDRRSIPSMRGQTTQIR